MRQKATALLLTSINLCLASAAGTASQTPIAQCLTTLNSKFCTSQDDQSLSQQDPTVGWCCPATDVVSPQCQSTTLCTNVVTEKIDAAQQNLYYSFTPGLISNYNKLCGTQQMTLTAGSDTAKVATTSISSTVPCVYVVKAQHLYKPQTTIGAFVEIANGVEVYMFKGDSRQNTHLLIEQNGLAAIGAAIQAQWRDGIVIVAKLQPGAKNGEFQFSYQMQNIQLLSPWEQVFVDQPYYAIWASTGAIALAVLLILVGSCVWCAQAAKKKRERALEEKRKSNPDYDRKTSVPQKQQKGSNKSQQDVSQIQPFDIEITANDSTNDNVRRKLGKGLANRGILKKKVNENLKQAANTPQSPVDFEVFDLINLYRTQPQVAVKDLQERKKQFSNPKNPKIRIIPGESAPVVTFEGVVPVNEAILLMKKLEQAPLLPLSWNDQLNAAAQFHTLDTGPEGLFGHEGSDGTQFTNRLQIFLQQQKQVGECISYGASQAKEIVLQLLIDDGVPSRGHRLLLTDKKFNQIGIFTGFHKKWKTMTTIDLCRNEA